MAVVEACGKSSDEGGTKLDKVELDFMFRRISRSPIILILPAIIAISLVVIIPLIFSFYTSFTSYKLTRPDSLYNFVGS